jgi:formate dehydrogenase subunit gamma
MAQVTDSEAAIRSVVVRRIAEQHAGSRGPLLPVLHGVMEELGHIAPEDVVDVARVLNLSVAEVHGVVSFYKDFRTTPPVRHRVQLCRAEACQAVGAQGVYDGTLESLGRRPDVEVDEVFCLGNCALGPSGLVDGRLHGRLTVERLESLTRERER